MVEKENSQDQKTQESAPVDNSHEGLIPLKVDPLKIDPEKLKKMFEEGRMPKQGRGGRCGGCDIRMERRSPRVR